MDSPNYDLFYLGALKLQSGVTLPGAKLAYKTFGSLSPTKDNLIVFPCAYKGLLAETEVAKMPNARCVPIPTIWDRVAGNAGANSVDTKFVNDRIAELLAS
jgi:homoserine acetyltransferase